MSDDNHNDEQRDMTMEVSGDELRALRQSSQLKAYSRQELDSMDSLDGLSEQEDDSTKAINRDSLVKIIKSEIRESHDTDDAKQGFGIIKRTNKPKLKLDKITNKASASVDPNSEVSTKERPLPHFDELGSVNSDATLSVSADVLRSLREDPLERTLDEPLPDETVNALFDDAASEAFVLEEMRAPLKLNQNTLNESSAEVDEGAQTIAISKEMVSEAEQLAELSAPYAAPVDTPLDDIETSTQPSDETSSHHEDVSADMAQAPEAELQLETPDKQVTESAQLDHTTDMLEVVDDAPSSSRRPVIIITLLLLLAVVAVILLKLSGLLG